MCSFPLGGFGIGTNGIPCAVGRLAVEFGRNCTSGYACPRFYLFLPHSPYAILMSYLLCLSIVRVIIRSKPQALAGTNYRWGEDEGVAGRGDRSVQQQW